MTPAPYPAKDDTMILFSNINKWYGDYQALADINAEVKKGEVVVVCGPSGSGKSTLIRTVNRLEEVKSGQLLFDGQDIHAPMRSAALNKLRSRIGFVFDEQIENRSVHAGSVRVWGTDGVAVLGSFNVQETVVNFVPDAALQPAMTYVVEIPAGGVTDLSGNPITQTWSMRFSTGAEVQR